MLPFAVMFLATEVVIKFVLSELNVNYHERVAIDKALYRPAELRQCIFPPPSRMKNNSKPVLPLVVPNSGRWLGNDGTWSAYVYILTLHPEYE